MEFLARELGISTISSRLERCLKEIFPMGMCATRRKKFERSLEGKAAKLFYMTIKSRPFKQRNERMAAVLTSIFLVKNKRPPIKIKNFHELANWVVLSSGAVKEETILGTAKWLLSLLQQH